MTIQDAVILLYQRLVSDPNFQDMYKRWPKSFTRKRKLPFEAVVGMILHMIKESLQISCNWFGSCVGLDQPPSKQAFSQARHNLSAECFQALHEQGLELNYTMEPNKGLWMGYRVLGADGSTIRLPESDDLEKEFGRAHTKEGVNASPPMARISEFTDMSLKLVVSARCAPYTTSEEELAFEQLREVVAKLRKWGQKKILFVYDRGYPSEKFIALHIELGVDFVFRLPRNFNKSVESIVNSNEKENYLIWEDFPLLRVVNFSLSSGEIELLLTTLCDEKLYPIETLSEIYNGRWISMEEGYKHQKITMQLENFSGKSPLAIQQEYWATLVIANLIEMGCIEQEGPWIPGKLPDQHINRSVIFGSMREATFQVIFGDITNEKYKELFLAIAKRSRIKRRSGRNFSREKVGKPKRHHIYRRAC